MFVIKFCKIYLVKFCLLSVFCKMKNFWPLSNSRAQNFEERDPVLKQQKEKRQRFQSSKKYDDRYLEYGFTCCN